MQDIQAELKKQHDYAVNRMVMMSLSFIPIIGIPAFAALYVGEKVIENRQWTIALLFTAFVLSWAIILFRYKRVRIEVQEIEDKLKAIKQKSA